MLKIQSLAKPQNVIGNGSVAGSKLKKAEALGTVQVLTENEFLAMITN